MDIQRIWEYATYMNDAGITLGYEQLALIQNSLIVLQNDGHLTQVFFWGIINGRTRDYYISYGYTKDFIKNRIFFYSTNGKEWGFLPKSKKKWREMALIIPNCLEGDPSLKLKFADEALNENNPHRNKEMKEEDRVSAIVHLICEEAQIVPRGYLIKQPDGLISVNKCFRGLDTREAKQLKSYCHYRVPQQRWNTNLLTRSDYNYCLDFLDTVDIDIPQGCWALTFEQGGVIAYVKCLYWPGAIFFQKLQSPDCAWIYNGNGKKNYDITFMV